jgi:D-alanyl-D-alanine dipeptidase
MGTPFDYFDPLSHTDALGLSPEQRYHRDVLRDAMRRAGFRNYANEWWHYTLIDEPYRDQYFDVVVKIPRD